MIQLGRLSAGMVVGFGVWGLNYRHLTLHLENVIWDYEGHHYAMVLHGDEMLVSGLLGVMAMLTTTKIMSILAKKRRK